MSAEAFDVFRETYYRLVVTACEWRAFQVAEPESMADEVFKALDPETPQLSVANLYRAIELVVARAYRRSAAEQSFLDRMRGDGMVARPGPRDEDAVVLKALTALRRADRELLQMAYWDQLNEGEVALVTGRSVDAVRHDLGTAATRLRSRLARSSLGLNARDLPEVVAGIKPGTHTRR